MQLTFKRQVGFYGGVKTISWFSLHGELCSCSLCCGHFHHQADNMQHGNMWSRFGQKPGRRLDITNVLLPCELRGKKCSPRIDHTERKWYESNCGHAHTHTHTNRQTHFSDRFCVLSFALSWPGSMKRCRLWLLAALFSFAQLGRFPLYFLSLTVIPGQPDTLLLKRFFLLALFAQVACIGLP